MIFQPIYILKYILGYHPGAEEERITKVSRKTWKSWNMNGNIPDSKTGRKAKKNYDDYFNEMLEQFSAGTDQSNFIRIIDKLDDYFQKNSLSQGYTWELLFNNPFEKESKITVWQYFPNTKKQILCFEKKGMQIRSLLKEERFEEAADFICNINFPGLHFNDKNIIPSLEKAKTDYDFFIKSMLFMIRANLYCLASFDAEETVGKKQKVSHLTFLLPKFEKGKILPPVFLWFQMLKKKVGNDESWEKLCFSDAFKNYNEDNYLNPRLLRKWRYGEENPTPKTIKKFLGCLFPKDKYSKDDFLEIYLSWCFANIFQHLYMILDNLIHREKPVYKADSNDVVEFFEEFNCYFDTLAIEYKKLAVVE